MRLLLTACWQLGRRFHGLDCGPDHEAAIASLAELARARDADAIVVAGDVHSQGVPAPEALRRADAALARLAADAACPVVALFGGWEPAAALPFGRAILAAGGLHVVDAAHDPAEPLVQGRGGTVRAVPAPGGSAVQRLQAIEDGVERAARALTGDGRQVLVLPALPVPTGAGDESTSSSEALGATDAACRRVRARAAEAFDLVVVGGASRPSRDGRSVAPGAPWPFTLAEAMDDVDDVDGEAGGASAGGSGRGVAFASWGERGSLEVRWLPLPRGRRVVALSGSLAELATPRPSDDWIVARVEDPVPAVDAVRRLGDAHPGLLAVERRPRAPGRRPLDVVAQWARETCDRELDEAERDVLERLLAEAST